MTGFAFIALWPQQLVAHSLLEILAECKLDAIDTSSAHSGSRAMLNLVIFRFVPTEPFLPRAEMTLHLSD